MPKNTPLTILADCIEAIQEDPKDFDLDGIVEDFNKKFRPEKSYWFFATMPRDEFSELIEPNRIIELNPNEGEPDDFAD